MPCRSRPRAWRCPLPGPAACCSRHCGRLAAACLALGRKLASGAPAIAFVLARAGLGPAPFALHPNGRGLGCPGCVQVNFSFTPPGHRKPRPAHRGNEKTPQRKRWACPGGVNRNWLNGAGTGPPLPAHTATFLHYRSAARSEVFRPLGKSVRNPPGRDSLSRRSNSPCKRPVSRAWTLPGKRLPRAVRAPGTRLASTHSGTSSNEPRHSPPSTLPILSGSGSRPFFLPAILPHPRPRAAIPSRLPPCTAPRARGIPLASRSRSP
jgi:hypothetical protein